MGYKFCKEDKHIHQQCDICGRLDKDDPKYAEYWPNDIFGLLHLTDGVDTLRNISLCSRCMDYFNRIIMNAYNLAYHHYHQTGEEIPISNEIKTILEENKNVKSSND